MRKKHIRRLKKFADYIEALPSSRVQMSANFVIEGNEEEGVLCGCPCSHLPYVFPKKWKMSWDLNLCRCFPVRTKSKSGIYQAVEEITHFFGISYDDFFDTFVPSGYCTGNPSPAAMAHAIRLLIDTEDPQ